MGPGRRGSLWLAGLGIAGIGVAFLAPFPPWASRGDSRLADVDSVTASLRTLTQTITATGVVRPVVGAEINVGSRVSGTVQRLTVKVGDAVAAGDLLAEIDATELDARVEQSEAELAAAEAERERARSAFSRVERLVGEGVVPVADLDLARRDQDVAEARVLAAAASLRAARVTLGYTRISAPIRGVVAVVGTREGETVAASFASPTFVTLVDLGRLEVQAYVDETDIGRVSVGQRATFTVDTAPDVEFGATVVTIEPKAVVESSVVEYIATLRIDPRHVDPVGSAGSEAPEIPILRPEMTAHLRFELASRDDVLTLPRETLRRRDGRRSVLVLRDGAWVEQEVEVGWLTDYEAEILAGVAEGETVQKNPK